MTVTIMKKTKNEKFGWEYFKTWVGIFQVGIFWVEIFRVGIFRVGVVLIPLNDSGEGEEGKLTILHNLLTF